MKRRTLLAALLLPLLGGCVGIALQDQLDASIAGFEPLEIGFFESRYAVKVRLLNPNDTAIPFQGVVIDMTLDNKPFARGVSDQTGVVPRFGEAVIAVNLVGSRNLLQQFIDLATRDPKPLQYRLRGRLNTEGPGGVSFQSYGDLALPGSFLQSR